MNRGLMLWRYAGCWRSMDWISENQKVNITINTTRGPNINNTQGKTNTGRRSHKIKTEKTNRHRLMKNINTILTGHGQGHSKQTRPK